MFKSRLEHGSDKIYSYPPSEAMQKLFETLKSIFPRKHFAYQKFHISGKHKGRKIWHSVPIPSIRMAFRNANAILRGWLNFYCVGNASNHFSYIRYRLFHIVLKYLYFYVGCDPRFKKKNKKTKKVVLYQYIFEKYLKNVANKSSKWWQIDLPENAKGRSNKPLILIDPGAIRIQTPKIILKKMPSIRKTEFYFQIRL